MVMPGQSGRSFDIIRHLAGNVINIFNKRPAICTAPCDGMVIRMHYQWTFWILLASWSSTWYSWFHRDVITCASHFNAETQVRLDYINICLSYPYLIEENGERRYILYYRWIHWALLVMAALYYIPRKMSKVSDNAKVKKLFEDLALGAHRYDHVEKEQVERAAKYLAFNLNTHDGLYFKYLTVNVVTLVIDLFCIHFLNMIFQGRFMQYGFQVFPFSRDVEHFTDYMSRTFPPFVLCELGDTYKLTNKRTETLGCHLTVMELYEKIFFALWIWLWLLTFMTIIYILYLFTLYTSRMRLHVLRVAKPLSAVEANRRVKETVSSVISKAKIGDVYLLYRLRQHFSHARYYELLTKLSDPDYSRLLIDNLIVDTMQRPDNNDMRHRQKPQQKLPSKYQNALFNKGDGRLLPNSSILVE